MSKVVYLNAETVKIDVFRSILLGWLHYIKLVDVLCHSYDLNPTTVLKKAGKQKTYYFYLKNMLKRIESSYDGFLIRPIAFNYVLEILLAFPDFVYNPNDYHEEIKQKVEYYLLCAELII